MKSTHLPDGFPDTPEAWEKLIEAAPDHIDDPECPYDPNDPDQVEAYWRDAVLVEQGGLPEVQAASSARRADGARAAPRRAQEASVSVRCSADVVAWFKSTGKGWENRMDAVLRDYVKRQQQQ